MKIFASFSGELSRRVAVALRAWLPGIFPGVEVWISRDDIRAGRHWALEVKKQLDSADAGIICVTDENCESPWINFETGALLHRFGPEVTVFVLLIDVEESEVPSTLRQLQVVKLTREDIERLSKQLDRLQPKPIGEAAVEASLDSSWSTLELDIGKITQNLQQHADPRSAVRRLAKNYRKALALKPNVVFHDAVADEVFACARKASNRSHGILDAEVENYNHILVELYRKARSYVFSTSLPEYDGTWASPLGKAILDAHVESPANVTRVFVFETRDQVTAAHLASMKRQAECKKIDVRIYVNQEDDAFEFSTNYSRDFTVIDNGAAIGLTQSYGLNNLRATWHFGNKELVGQLRLAQTLLKRNSTPLASWPSAIKT